MSRIRSLLAKSQTIKSVHRSALQTSAKTYRKFVSRRHDTEIPSPSHDSSVDLSPYGGNEGIFEGDFQLQPHPDASNPVLTNDDITDCLASFVADPFIIYENGVYHMFFEICEIGGNVCIGHAFSEDGLEYEYNQVVIRPETGQQTYPHVFRWDGRWLMIPSPGSNVKGQFRIYKADDFPTEWTLIATPIAEEVRVDPTPIFFEGTWYLIYHEVGSYDVCLKYSDTLTDSNWKTHPDSPLFQNDLEAVEACTIGSAEMAPSGRPLYTDDSIHIFYRSHTHRQVYHYKITELTERSFSQNKVSDKTVFYEFKSKKWNEVFMHTVNPVYPWQNTENIVAVDGLDTNRRYSIGIYSLG